MLKVYISADIEGVNGVVYPHQTEISGGESYLAARKQQHDELNIIIQALLDSNVEKITVNDAHGTMENLIVSDLNPKIQLITGKPKPVSMLAGLDSSYDCVFFTGYHARAISEKGVLSHTFSKIFKDVRLNGKSIGEIELNGTYAGLNNVPIAFITGDDVTCQEAEEAIGKVKTVTTKKAISTSSAACKPNEQLFAELKSAVLETIKNPQNWILYKNNPPYTIELDFNDRRKADLAELLPGIKRISSSGIAFASDKYEEIYKLLQFLAATLS